MRVRLHEVAHSRAGDKGDTSILSLFPFDDRLYPQLVREVTVERVLAHFAGRIRGRIERFELPNLCALQFVCHQALDSGVTTSLVLDTHGKGMSFRLLSLPIEIKEDLG